MVESTSKKETGTTELVTVDTRRESKDIDEVSCSEGEDDLLVDADIKEEKKRKEKAEADQNDDDDSQQQKRNPIEFVRHLYATYDPSFISLIGTQYFNQGSKVLIALATQQLFKETYGLEPGYVQTLTGFIMLPWSIKLIYGLLSDNLPIFGSKRRSYLYIGACMQIVSMSLMAANIITSEVAATACLFFSNMAIAMADVVIDSLMVVQSRIDPKQGSEDLQTWSWTLCSLGGIFGSIAAAFLTEDYDPSYCYMISAIISLVIIYQTFMLSPDCEKSGYDEEEERDADGQIVERTFCQEVSRNFTEIGVAMSEPIFFQVIIYLMLTGALVPSFGSFGYYFMLDVVEISKFTYSLLGLLGFICLGIGTAMYQKYFKHYELRTLVLIEALVGLIFAPFSFLFVLRLNEQYGMSDMFVIIFTDVVQDTLSMAFVFLPTAVLFAKITPKNIEATCFALLAGISNFRSTFRGWTGSIINEKFVGVSQEDLSKYWQLVTIGFVCSFLPLFFIYLLPSKQDIDELQQKQIQKALQHQKPGEKENVDSIASNKTQNPTYFDKRDQAAQRQLSPERKGQEADLTDNI